MTDIKSLPTTRKEAKETGADFYYTGKPCSKGHLSKRRTTGICIECEKEYYKENREKRIEDSCRRKKEKAQEILEYNRRYRENNRERDRAWKRKYKENNPDKVKAQRKDYYNRTFHKWSEWAKKYYIENKDHINARNKEWAKNNPGKVRAKTARYIAKKKDRTLSFSDPYLAELNDLCMDEIYTQAAELSEVGDLQYEVDHITPISGNKVSGLHVWYNLQILPLSENRSKSNSFDGGSYD